MLKKFLLPAGLVIGGIGLAAAIIATGPTLEQHRLESAQEFETNHAALDSRQAGDEDLGCLGRLE